MFSFTWLKNIGQNLNHSLFVSGVINVISVDIYADGHSIEISKTVSFNSWMDCVPNRNALELQ